MLKTHEPLPSLRPVEARRVQSENGEQLVALIDPSQTAARTIALPYAGFVAVSLFDGRRTAVGVQRAAARRLARPVAVDDILELAAALDEALLLDSPRAAAAFARLRAEYAAVPVRDGSARWPKADALRSQIEQMLAVGRAPGGLRMLTGLIAPHLDYARGGPCYADAYAAYNAVNASAPAERFVILGTNHFGQSTGVCATGKDFATPLGLARMDRDLLRRVEERLGQSLCEHERDHLREHSVEMQVHILQHLHPEGDVEILPILCPSPTGPTGFRPSDGNGPDLRDFADALATELAADGRPTLVIASADLSHIGMSFGERGRTTPEFMQTVAEWDESLLREMEAGRADEFVARVTAAQNKSRICSVGCLYALARVLGGGELRTLRYHQASDFDAETHVTCAAGVA